MQDYKARFLELAFAHGALKLGRFTLKSGRASPYFFNLGAIATGSGLAQLAACYADALEQSGIACDGLFGPAYKGIPLAATLACEMARRERSLGFAYDRKEAKDHGEGGNLVGQVAGRMVIVDDVITAGTAVRAAMATLRASGAEPVVLLVALDRQERGTGQQSAIQELAAEGIPTVSVCTLADLLGYLQAGDADPKTLAAIEAYRACYGEGDGSQSSR
ncbi:MAG: orotate phosphoribosyltransferase [Salinisphaera sp.]|nr:orotate phosphoribosyltransferase [Salinisphaera sp.]MDN5938786.1 orotate phosphoribosyltransferase [Salinisphaera sp.]